MTLRATAQSRSVPSLGRRLPIWLALQGLLVALLVSGAVYSVNHWVLESRQQDVLRLKSGIVRHALAESGANAEVGDLRHKLTDFLAGHEDLTLSVTAQEGQVLFNSATTTRVPLSERRIVTVSWQDRWPSETGVAVTVNLGLDVSRDHALLTSIGWVLLSVSLCGAAVVSGTGFLLVNRGLRPVHQLSDQVDAVTLGKSRMRREGAGQPSELRPLVARFNALLERVDRAYAQLEGFNADVAHELRTPLTTLIGSSELALQRDRPAAELRDVIAGNLEDLRRLAVIVNDMLFVSLADRGAGARRAPVNSISAELGEIIDFHEAALQERSLSANCRGDAQGAFDLSLLRRAVSNLLSNATRYATPGSTIQVRIEAVGARVRIWIENEGSPIAQQQLPRLFDRFHKIQRSRHRSGVANCGLGLAIDAAIARMHQGEPFATSSGDVTAIGLDIPSSPGTA